MTSSSFARINAKRFETKRQHLLKFSQSLLQFQALFRPCGDLDRGSQVSSFMKHRNFWRGDARVLEYFHRHAKCFRRCLPPRILGEWLAVAFRTAKLAR